MNLPPYISRTPPPLNETEDDEDEEFGTFAVCSDLGEEVCDVFDKTSNIRNEDNVSEDSGFCMNSVGQTQSPCDISPLSSSYNKGNECMTVDNHDILLNSSVKDADNCKVEIKTNDNCQDRDTFFRNSESSSDNLVNSSESVTMPEFSNTFQSKCFFSQNSNADIGSVNFVDESSVFEPISNILSSTETVSNPESRIQVANDSMLNKELETNNIDDTDMPSCDSSFAFRKQTTMLVKNDSVINKELKPESSHDTEMGVGTMQNTAFSFSSFSESGANYIIDETVIKEQIKEEDGWGSNDDDEFSDFTGFQSMESFPIISKYDSKLQYIFEERDIIQDVADSITETLYSAIENNIVWNKLLCFEETPAFKYQWSTSITQMKFLHALQIDSRNILYGPWNRMSKCSWTDVSNSFESSNSITGSTPTSATTKNKEMIPDPHFDWMTSGLTNPLQGNRDGKGTVTTLGKRNVSETVSTKSSEVLNSLPKLNFLKSTYINFK